MKEQFIAITGRNLKLYFRDRGAVFFSLLSMIIVIGLMVFFLGDMSIEGLINVLAEFSGRDGETDEKNAELIIYLWTCAGILAINAVTVTLAVYSVMIKDRVSGKINSIHTAPIGPVIIAGGYITAAWMASVCICMVTLIIVELIGLTKGMELFSVITHIKLLGLIMVNSFAYATLMYVVALLAKTEGAWSGMGTVVGTLVGFLGGIYIPIGSLSGVIGAIMKCTPIIYGTAVFREVMLQDITDIAFEGLPQEFVTEYSLEMGIQLEVCKHQMSTSEELLILTLCGMIFLMISVGMLKYGKKADR